MTSLRDINERDAMLSSVGIKRHYAPAIYVDHDGGNYDDAKNIVIIDVSQWDDYEIDVWELMTDSERQGYALDIKIANEQTATPSEYMREIGEIQCLHNEK